MIDELLKLFEDLCEHAAQQGRLLNRLEKLLQDMERGCKCKEHKK